MLHCFLTKVIKIGLNLYVIRTSYNWSSDTRLIIMSTLVFKNRVPESVPLRSFARFKAGLSDLSWLHINTNIIENFSSVQNHPPCKYTPSQQRAVIVPRSADLYRNKKRKNLLTRMNAGIQSLMCPSNNQAHCLFSPSCLEGSRFWGNRLLPERVNVWD